MIVDVNVSVDAYPFPYPYPYPIVTPLGYGYRPSALGTGTRGRRRSEASLRGVDAAMYDEGARSVMGRRLSEEALTLHPGLSRTARSTAATFPDGSPLAPAIQ